MGLANVIGGNLYPSQSALVRFSRFLVFSSLTWLSKDIFMSTESEQEELVFQPSCPCHLFLISDIFMSYTFEHGECLSLSRGNLKFSQSALVKFHFFLTFSGVTSQS